MSNEDLELFIALAADTERCVAGMTRDDRAMTISSMIRTANIAYAVWREGETFRLRLLRCVEPTGDDETLCGIPVSCAAHANLLEAAASHGQEFFR